MSGGEYFLGLPAWAFPGWKDRYFTDEPTRLASYARVFNSVEGNTTFYRTPDAGTACRWRESVADREFRFCFKLPREVTHEARPDFDVLHGFIRAMEILGDSLGPLFVQFPAKVGPGELEAFTPVLTALGEQFPFVIEVRHPAFFDDPGLLLPILEQFQAGRVVLDSRPLFEGDRRHPELLTALHEKPDLPVLPVVYNNLALVRLILHPDIGSNRRYIDEWAGHVAGYLEQGVTTYMMIHCPNNLHCPPLAREFHTTLRRMVPSLPELPPWPVPKQLALLFG